MCSSLLRTAHFYTATLFFSQKLPNAMQQKEYAEAIIEYDPKQLYTAHVKYRDHHYKSPSEPAIEAFLKRKIESNTTLEGAGIHCVVKEQQIKKTWLLGRIIGYNLRLILEGPSYETIKEYLPKPIGPVQPDKNLDHLLQQLHTNLTPLRDRASFRFQTKQLKDSKEALLTHFERCLQPYLREDESGDNELSLEQLMHKYKNRISLYWQLQTDDGIVDVECGKLAHENNRFFIASINEPIGFILALRTSLLSSQQQKTGMFDIYESFYERFELQTRITKEHIREQHIQGQMENLKPRKKSNK